MCGIFGFLYPQEKKALPSVIKSLYRLSDNRGKEASGFCLSSAKELTYYKTPFSGSKLIKGKAFSEFVENNQEDFSIIGHSRLVTDGYEHIDENNQPVVTEKTIAVHNGIIVNHNEIWNKYFGLKERTSILDSLIITALGDHFARKELNTALFLKTLFAEVKGVFNTALFLNNQESCLLASNNGSLYYCKDNKGQLVFASEKYILSELFKEFPGLNFTASEINQLKPGWVLVHSKEGTYLNHIDDVEDIKIHSIDSQKSINKISGKKYELGIPSINTSMEYSNNGVSKSFKENLANCEERIKGLKRCSKCLLPETFPFINYGKAGECNYCKSYIKNLITDISEFNGVLAKSTAKNNIESNCLVPFSGGRDSSYALHYVVKEMGLKPMAFSYDWGMLTDLSRRNQSLMCGELGVEHVLISADIRKKRKNIKKNVAAWLKRPSLGAIPLFMAGDKQYFYYANLLMEQNSLDVSIMGENMLETTMFKSGFCGIKPKFQKVHTYSLSTMDKLKMMGFYSKEFLLNPAYINSSILDSLDAFKSYYLISHKNVNLFDYMTWDENLVNDTLLGSYNWETDPETDSTWRIGDGTAAFYNYIYLMVAGFTENDTFRSSQIREGQITREDGLELIEKENKPRWNSIQWYCNTIGIDWEMAIKKINSIKTLY
jgi:glucosamine--fructose-6-phosphate aminotransferase (isomerizing)